MAFHDAHLKSSIFIGERRRAIEYSRAVQTCFSHSASGSWQHRCLNLYSTHDFGLISIFVYFEIKVYNMAKNFQATGSERAKILKYLKDLFHWRLRLAVQRAWGREWLRNRQSNRNRQPDWYKFSRRFLALSRFSPFTFSLMVWQQTKNNNFKKFLTFHNGFFFLLTHQPRAEFQPLCEKHEFRMSVTKA